MFSLAWVGFRAIRVLLVSGTPHSKLGILPKYSLRSFAPGVLGLRVEGALTAFIIMVVGQAFGDTLQYFGGIPWGCKSAPLPV